MQNILPKICISHAGNPNEIVPQPYQCDMLVYIFRPFLQQIILKNMEF